ncbi:MAG: hypothetical protein GKR77_07725, partial [Legionellales bacterium]|nr:hypothetical protein [Legionellales bacterium]
MKSKSYQWHAITADGQCQQGVLTAADRTQAKIILMAQGFAHIQLRRQLKLNWPLRHQSTLRLTTNNRIQFYRQLALLLTAGIPLHQATQFVIHLLPDTLSSLPEKIHTGTPLSQALEHLYPYWPKVALTLIQLGERTGQLDDILCALADNEQQIQTIKNQWINAVFYPLLMVAMALLVGLFFLIVIVPQFAHLFSQWSTALPSSTQWLLYSSQWFIDYGIWVVSGLMIGSAALGYRYYLRPSSRLHYYLRRIPGLKQLFLLRDYLQIVYTLQLTYQAGLPLVEGIALVSDGFTHKPWFNSLRHIAALIQQGIPLTDALRQATQLPEPLL